MEAERITTNRKDIGQACIALGIGFLCATLLTKQQREAALRECNSTQAQTMGTVGAVAGTAGVGFIALGGIVSAGPRRRTYALNALRNSARRA